VSPSPSARHPDDAPSMRAVWALSNPALSASLREAKACAEGGRSSGSAPPRRGGDSATNPAPAMTPGGHWTTRELWIDWLTAVPATCVGHAFRAAVGRGPLALLGSSSASTPFCDTSLSDAPAGARLLIPWGLTE
jgi:hypothetical protein